MGLPYRAQLRHAWLSCDAFSSQWVTAWPSDEHAISHAEFSPLASPGGVPEKPSEAAKQHARGSLQQQLIEMKHYRNLEASPEITTRSVER